MNTEDVTGDDDPFSALLAAWYDALAAGRDPDPEATPPAGLRARLERGLGCLRRLRQWGAARQPDDTPPALPAPSEGLPWPVLGRFELRRELGRGAFGVVFLAYDPLLGREVALKVPRPEVAVAPGLAERFHREARAAASLDHPNLVPVHEAGAVGPVCYLVSTYCPGTTLAEWLKGRGEPVPFADAAALVATLAAAVQHAHERGVLHRDLKPANVLLSAGGPQAVGGGEPSPLAAAHGPLATLIPRITDFGLARLLGADPAEGAPAVATRSGAIVGTPCYMAPEQAAGKGKGVGPSADVYALGAILYELLTGRPPFRGESDLDTLLLVQSEEPVPPGRLRQRLPRDLETICLKCLRKEPYRRYPSTQGLADDLGRWIHGEPIVARPVGLVERAAQWAWRRPLAAAFLGLSVAAAAALLVVWTSLTVQVREQRDLAAESARQADRARRRAEANQEKALAAVDSFLTRVGENRLAAVPGVEDLRRELLEDSLEFAKGFVADNDDPDPRARRDLGLAYQRLGRIQIALGRTDDAVQAYRQAVAIQQGLAEEAPNDPEPRADMAKSYNNLAILYRGGNVKPDFARADEALDRALALKEDLVRERPDNPEYQVSLAKSLVGRGQLERQRGRADLTEGPLLRAVDLLEAVVRDHGDRAAYRAELAAAVNSAGALYLATDRQAAAESSFQRARDLFRSLAEAEPRVRSRRESLAAVYNNLGAACAALGHDADAVTAYESAVKLWEQFIRDSPALVSYSHGLGMTLLNLGMLHVSRGRHQEARAPLERAAATFQALIDKQPTDWVCKRDLAKAIINLGQVAYAAGRWEEAAAKAQEARPLVEAFAVGQSDSPEVAELRANAAGNRGLALRMLGRDGEALRCLDEAIDVAARALQRDGRLGVIRKNLSSLSWARGDLYAGMGRPEPALADWERAARADPGGAERARQASHLVEALRLALRGEHARAVEDLGALTNHCDADLTPRFAWVYVRAAWLIDQSQRLAPEERARLTADYHRRAVALLERAESEGFFHSPEYRRRLAADPLFAPLRGRDDFQKLLRRVEKTAVAPETK
ncbi:MAG TPA: serine/threonine-protein kinase [Gemmataceae bacterium]|nr:serine/threonine-protein kinase [Gemmataceae bacterium]